MQGSVRKALRFFPLVLLLSVGLVAAASAAGSGTTAGTGSTAGTGGTANAGAASRATPKPTPWLFIGARMGVAYEYAKPSDFNDTVQPFFPSKNSYFPVYSVIGLSLTESIAISDTSLRLTLTQMPTVSGLDQNYAIPRLNLLVGVQTDFGLEGGVGAQLEPVVAPSGSGVEVGPSLVYSVGWRFHLGQVSIPITLTADPLPPRRHPRATLTAGIDYGFAPKLPKRPRSPFNY